MVGVMAVTRARLIIEDLEKSQEARAQIAERGLG